MSSLTNSTMYITRHIIVYPSVRLISYTVFLISSYFLFLFFYFLISSYGIDFSTLHKNAFTTSGSHTFPDDDDDNY